MKKQLLPILLTLLMSMVGTKVFAYDIKVENADGVTFYYNYINNGKDLEVTKIGYIILNSGSVVIPEEVTYMNRTRKVTRIGNNAFYNHDMTSITIPNSVTSIGDNAFLDCSGLTSVAIGNSVTSIGFFAFRGCINLASVHITDIESWCNISFYSQDSNPLNYAHHLFLNGEEIKDLIIPKSVTSIGNGAFSNCSGLTSVTIPNNVKSIGKSAFYGCSGLTSITIPNSVTSVGNYAFSECSGLTSVTIPNSVTSIGNYAFSECSGLTSITIPNSVTSIEERAFYGCSGLTSVTIPNSVTSIGNNAFDKCNVLTSIISLIEKPFVMEGKASDKKTFHLDAFNNATLYVPVGTIDKYKNTSGWKDFLFIEEGSGPNGGSNTPETKKCATPTIFYQNGKLTFASETEGASYKYTISDDDIKSGNSNEVQLGVTYHISVYATKDGYENSDIATATLCWIDVEPKTEGITNGIANVRARAVLIQNSGNILTVSGADEGTTISVFDMNGRPVGSEKASSEATNINTSLRSGDIGVVKIGDKAVKVLMK